MERSRKEQKRTRRGYERTKHFHQNGKTISQHTQPHMHTHTHGCDVSAEPGLPIRLELSAGSSRSLGKARARRVRSLCENVWLLLLQLMGVSTVLLAAGRGSSRSLCDGQCVSVRFGGWKVMFFCGLGLLEIGREREREGPKRP